MLSLVIVAFSYFISLYGGYKSNLKIREIRQNIQNNLSFSMIKEGSFIKFKDIVIYADKKEDNKAYNIIIYNSANTKNDNKNILVQAKSAEINNNIITLFDGSFQRSNDKIDSNPEILFFKEYNVNFDDLMNGNTSSTIKRVDSSSIVKLIDILRNYDKYAVDFPNKNKVIYELNYRLTFPLISVLMALLSGSLVLRGAFNRISNYKNIMITSIISVLVYIIFLSLYQKISSNIIYVYILYSFMFLILIVSGFLIREKKKI